MNVKNLRNVVSPYIAKPIRETIDKLPLNLKSTWFLRGFGFYKLPMIAFVWPRVQELTDVKSVLEIPLNYRTQNHLGVMYFGALSIGAEAVIALHVIHEIQKSKKPIDFIFKSFEAKFLKRAESSVQFFCVEGEAIRNLIREAGETTERKTATFSSYAITPDKTGEEHVAEFKLELSVRCRK